MRRFATAAAVSENSAMNQTAPQAKTDPAEAVLVYEQPLSERMRTFLRLEFLYQQALHHWEHGSSWSTRATVDSLLEILAILTRGDVRGEVIKELERQSSRLSQFYAQPGVDSAALQKVLNNLVRLRDDLSGAGVHITHRLKECEFLSAIKHRSAIPGGTCEFDLPEFSHWLNRHHDQRSHDLAHWFTDLRPLCDSASELLWLIRESGLRSEVVAEQGMYQQALGKGTQYELLRVGLPQKSPVYPAISGSQKRFTVRFMHWQDVDNRPVQSETDTRFVLTCC